MTGFDLGSLGPDEGEAAAAVIDWTSLTAFYGRLGAHAWRAYQRAEGEP